MGSQFHTYAMERVTRWVIFCLWREDLLTPRPGPAPVKSWWFKLVMAARIKVQREPITERILCPVDEIESGITELCIQQLPEKLRQTIVVSNLGGGTAEDKALELGCDRRTYFRRLDRAYAELLGLFNDHEASVPRVDLVRTLPLPAPVSARVQCGERKRPLVRGIAREVLLDKNATPR